MSSYRGHTLNCGDISKLSSIGEGIRDVGVAVDGRLSELSQKVNDLITFANADPTVATNILASFSKAVTAAEEVATSARSCMQTINGVVNALTDYADGNWSDPNNKAFLDSFINTYGSGKGSGKGSSDGGGGGGTGMLSDSITNPEITNEELTLDDDIDVSGSLTDYYDAQNYDEEISIPQIGVDASNGGNAVAPGISDDTALGADEDNLDASDLGSSISSLGNAISIPSPVVGDIEGVKSSSALGAVGIAAASAAAIGGKVYYDKKHEKDDEDDEDNLDELDGDAENDDDIDKSNSSVVNFKEEIFKIGDDD